MATSAADFPKAERLHEAHKVIEAHVGEISALDPREEKIGLHTA
ncbi:MAG: hypothetical protein ACRDRW_14130 [Pseudonocardiaceae bacterium]